jgi:hypothetical protein
VKLLPQFGVEFDSNPVAPIMKSLALDVVIEVLAEVPVPVLEFGVVTSKGEVVLAPLIPNASATVFVPLV